VQVLVLIDHQRRSWLAVGCFVDRQPPAGRVAQGRTGRPVGEVIGGGWPEEQPSGYGTCGAAVGSDGR